MTGRHRLAGMLALLIVAGCSRQPASDMPARADGTATLNEQVTGDMNAIRLKMAEARIVQLERQVATLQNTPEKLDLQLLTQRVEKLEGSVYADAGRDQPPEPRAEPRSEPRSEPKPAPSPTPNRFNPFGL